MSGKVPAWSWGLLVAILLFDVWLRGHTIGPTVRDRLGLVLWPVVRGEAEPLDCDEAAYAYMGRRMVRGDVLYRDLTENKPPLGYELYALAVRLGGATELTVRLMPVPLVLGAMVLVWLIGMAIGGPATACLAALIYAVASTDPYLYGNGAHLEHAINFFSLLSLALMIGVLRRPGNGLLAMAAGAAVGAACLVRQVAIVLLPIDAIILGGRLPGESLSPPVRVRIRRVGWFFAGFGLVWALAAAGLVLRGAGTAAWADVVRFGGALATDTPVDPHEAPWYLRWLTGNTDPEGVLPWPFGSTAGRAWWGTGLWPLWLASVPAGAIFLFGRSSTTRRLIAAWTLAAWVQVILPGQYWQHYYLLPTPGVALMVAALVVDVAQRTSGSIRLRWAWAGGLSVLLAALGWTGWIQYRDYLSVAPELLTRRYKGGQQWVVLRGLGRDLGRRARVWPAAHLYVWGWQSPLYFYSGLDSPARLFFENALVQAVAARNDRRVRPEARRMIQERLDGLIRDLRARPPELLFVGDRPFPELRRLLADRYIRLEPTGLPLLVERDAFSAFRRGLDAPARE